jgi:hypothetical protein
MGVETVTWANCYDDGWQAGADIVRAAFAHPAKMAKGLLSRILTHGLAEGFWRLGDVLGDPFGGIGTTGIMAAYHGLHALLVELEPKFVALAAENFALHRRRWEALGVAPPVVLQGDSRRFAELVGGVAGAVTSPPYAGSLQCAKTDEDFARQRRRVEATGKKLGGGQLSHDSRYGAAPGQIGSLPPGDVDAVVTSPPYADAATNGARANRAENLEAAGIDAKRWLGNARCTQGRSEGYGKTDGQISALPAGPLDEAVTSPPFMGQNAVKEKMFDKRPDGSDFGAGAAMKNDYDEKVAYEKRGFLMGEEGYKEWAATCNIGSITTSQPTYWSEMAKVYAQVHAALKPRGVLAVVVKDYVKGGARVPLCDQTATLLERLGFTVFLRCRAMLVREWEEPSLFGGPVKRRRERKSFFRRLHEARLPAGDPRRIDHEEVLWCRRS